jgi:hypothetical protein
MKPDVLLKAYAVHQSEDAFRELVAVSLDEVYSTALRIARGASHLAEETALRVYWELAREAPKLGEDGLASWLHEHTCKTAVIVLREDGRYATALRSRTKCNQSRFLRAWPRPLADWQRACAREFC